MSRFYKIAEKVASDVIADEDTRIENLRKQKERNTEEATRANERKQQRNDAIDRQIENIQKQKKINTGTN